MIGLKKFDEKYFEKFATTPVWIKPYDPKQKIIGEKLIKELEEVLKDYKLDVILRGSTAFEISGKGDVEVGVYPVDSDWLSVISRLTEKYGSPASVEENYAHFDLKIENFNVEIILLKGHDAVVDKALHNFLLTHPEILKEYESVKQKFRFSRREYYKQKHLFFSKIIESL